MVIYLAMLPVEKSTELIVHFVAEQQCLTASSLVEFSFVWMYKQQWFLRGVCVSDDAGSLATIR